MGAKCQEPLWEISHRHRSTEAPSFDGLFVFVLGEPDKRNEDARISIRLIVHEPQLEGPSWSLIDN